MEWDETWSFPLALLAQNITATTLFRLGFLNFKYVGLMCLNGLGMLVLIHHKMMQKMGWYEQVLNVAKLK